MEVRSRDLRCAREAELYLQDKKTERDTGGVLDNKGLL